MKVLISILLLNVILLANCHCWVGKLSWLTDLKGDDSDGGDSDSDDSTGDGTTGDWLSGLHGGGSTGDDGDGSTGDGSTGDGSTGDGSTGDGSTGDGSTGDWLSCLHDGGLTGDDGDGSTGDGSTGDGSTGDGATGDGSTGDGSTGDGSTGDGSTGDGSTGDWLSCLHDGGSPGDDGDSSTGDGSTGDGSTGDGSTGDGSTGDGSTGDGSTGDGATGDWLSCLHDGGLTGDDGDGSTGDGSTGDGSTGDGSTGDGSTGDWLSCLHDGGSPGDDGDGSTGDGSTGDGSTGDGSTGDGSTGDGSTGDGSTGDGSTGDGSTGDGSTGDGSTGDVLTDPFERFLDRLYKILSLLLKHLLDTTNCNIVVSPSTMVKEYIGFGISAREHSTTCNEILHALGLYSQDELYIVISQLNKYILSMETNGSTLTTNGNFCFADDLYPLAHLVKQVFKFLIRGKATNINLRKEIGATAIMSGIITKLTDNHITEVITPGDGYITPDTNILGVAAQFFQPKYKYELKIGPRYLFRPDCEKCRTCGPRVITFMEQIAISKYILSEELDAHVAEMKMLGYPNIANYLILPRSNNITRAVSNLSLLKELIPQMTETLTRISVPVYEKYDNIIDIKEFAQKYLNINAMYNEGAEFDGLTGVDNTESVYISDSIHRAVYARGTRGGPWPEYENATLVNLICRTPFLHVTTIESIPVMAVVRRCLP